jgi:DNA-binding NarL/FixJ family response regulator
VLAHRNAWLRDKVAARLEELGVAIVGVYDDGADAAGTVVVEQPDLLLVEDRLPTLSGIQLTRRARDFAPHTVVGAQVLDGAHIPALVDAGAHAVFTRRIPPVEIADQLMGCLSGRRSPRPLTLV